MHHKIYLKQHNMHQTKKLNFQDNNGNPYNQINTQRTNRIIDYNTISYQELNKCPQLPPLRMKESIDREKHRQIKSQRKDKNIKTILSILKKQLSIEKKNYFETINTPSTLIIKGNERHTSSKTKISLNMYTQMLVTPKYKKRPLKRVSREKTQENPQINQSLGRYHENLKEKSKKKLNNEAEIDEFSPWSHQKSQFY